MKKNIYLILLASLLFSSRAKTQNLVNDASFESFPTQWSTVNNVEIFSDSYLTGGGIPGILSTDCQNTSNFIHPSIHQPDNYFGIQTPNSGINYAGVYAFNCKGNTVDGSTKGFIGIELSEELLKDVPYEITYYISRMDNSTITTNYNVIFSKNITSEGKPLNKKKEFKKIISSTDWQLGFLHYTPDVDGVKYIFFEAYDNYLIPPTYLSGFYLDDVRVIDKCTYNEMNCYVTSGPFYPEFPVSNCSYNAPFKVTNIENASYVKLEIFDDIGQLVFETEENSCDGFYNPFFWPGNTSPYGAAAAAAPYVARVTLSNLCVTENVFTHEFVKTDNLIANPTLWSWTNYNSPPCTRIPVIPDCDPNIFVDDIFTDGDDYEYISTDALSTSNDVKVYEGASLKLKAPHFIELSPGFHAVAGSYFLAKIENNSLKYNNNNTNVESSNDSLNYNKVENNDLFKISPNPNNGNMQVIYELPENETGAFEVYDLVGKKLFSNNLVGGKNTFSISRTDLDQGIYFYRVVVGNKLISSDKIVVIK